jgi:hypothetical protein
MQRRHLLTNAAKVLSAGLLVVLAASGTGDSSAGWWLVYALGAVAVVLVLTIVWRVLRG